MCNSNNAGFHALPTTVGYHGHDLRFNRNPMFTFGMSRNFAKSAKVGAKMPLGLDKSNITRFGNQDAPKFSIIGRWKTSNEGAHSPGPAYLINDKLTRQTPPKFSIAARTKESSRFTAPGPKYAFSGDLGKPSAPSFSLGIRTSMDYNEKMPSSAEYAAPNLNACRPRAPQMSMSFRQKEIGDNFSGPGPNSYLPKFKSSAKGFSFGIRHHPCSGRITLPEDDY